MKAKFTKLILVLVFLSASALVTYAALHAIGNPLFSGGSLNGEITVAGYGRSDLEASMTVTGSNITAICVNPAGHIAPGRSTVSFVVEEDDLDSTEENGNTTFFFSVDLLSPVEAEGACNRNWSVTDLSAGIVDVQIRIATLEGFRSQSLVLNFECDLTGIQSGDIVPCTEQ